MNEAHYTIVSYHYIKGVDAASLTFHPLTLMQQNYALSTESVRIYDDLCRMMELKPGLGYRSLVILVLKLTNFEAQRGLYCETTLKLTLKRGDKIQKHASYV